ncbi:MAG: DUF2806 domain-containing protein [Sulfitobacter sp.]
MPSEEKKTNWLEVLVEGGLPQLIAGPAGKAISRLLGAAVEVPATYIDSFAQGIKDNTAAKSNLTKAMGEKVAEMVVADPEIMDRAVNSLLAKQLRAQTNKEEIVKIAMEDLKAVPPSEDSDGPSDDWLNKFERHAEDASSNDLRLLYAKILTCEIRDTGSISPSTLHFVSMLHGDVVRLIERVLPLAGFNGIAYYKAINPSLSHLEQTLLDQSGFWTMEKVLPVTLSDKGRSFINVRADLGFLLIGPINHTLKLQVALLSKAGTDLVKVINRDFDDKSFAEIMFVGGVTQVFAGRPIEGSPGSFHLEDSFEIPQSGPPAS